MPAGHVLILGASGFVGHALATRLAGSGVRVSLLARSVRPDWSMQPGIEYYQASMDDTGVLGGVLPSCDWVIHLACDTVPGTTAGAHAEAAGNLLPTLKFLDLLKVHRGVRLLFVSTGGAIYGDVDSDWVNEDCDPAPLSYYGAGKAAVEAFVRAFGHQESRDAVILRPSNLYGPGQMVRPGFGIIPALLNAADTGQRFEIWGDGGTVRDFLYVGDFLDLCERILAAPARTGVRTWNAGSGEGHSLNDLCRRVEEVTGRRIERHYSPARRVDVRRIVLDSRRATAELGWSPATRLQEGLTRTWQWFTKNPR
jgi:UDP-glucose 4-epimerase